MQNDGISKLVFYLVICISVVVFVFVFGVYSGFKQNFAFKAVSKVYQSVKLVMGSSGVITGTHPSQHLQKARSEGDGVVVNNCEDCRDELILMAGFFKDDNKIRLVDREGTIINEWVIRFDQYFPDHWNTKRYPNINWRSEIAGCLVHPDGSVVFSFEDVGLLKLDKCGNVIWQLDIRSHHSVERAEGGGYWVCGRIAHDEKNNPELRPYRLPYLEDSIVKVSGDGRVLREISIPGLFYENGMESVLTSTGHALVQDMEWDEEIVHANKVEELTSDIADRFALFSAGDLMISLRTYNIIMVVDPVTRKIKWWRTGPWIRQHDPEFTPDGEIVVFNNNSYYTDFEGGFLHSPVGFPVMSNLIAIDPATDRHRIVYGSRKGQEMLTIVKGKLELTPRGGYIIAEFEGGRVFETDADGRTIWEYINRYDSDEVGEVVEARIYPKSYFSVTNWSECKQ